MKLFIIYHSLITYIHLTLFFYISSNFYLRSGKYLFQKYEDNTTNDKLFMCSSNSCIFFSVNLFLVFLLIGFSKIIIHSSISHIPKYNCACFNVFSNETGYMTSLNTFGKLQQKIKNKKDY